MIEPPTASAEQRSSDPTDRRLPELLGEVESCLHAPSPSQRKLVGKITHLAERLRTDRFQLAVLGQFKRGKSTLLNALLREAVLPTGVVPVTAIPTFLEVAESLRLRVSNHAGQVDEMPVTGIPELRERLNALVTEDANPENRLGIARVDVHLPSKFLASGLVLIDTPGVGSTFRHNTTAADAVLPECDATLFVVSPDPPITEVEIQFLSRIRETVVRLIVVLNKVDTLEPDERETATAFLRRMLSEQAGINGETPIFRVSARGALRALEAGDAGALEASGFPALEAHLTQFLAHEKQATLHAAVARKASALLTELQLETEIALKALRLPLEDLEQRMASFDEAAKRFEVERRAAADLLAGDRLRALQELEADAERLRDQSRRVLEREMDDALGADAHADRATGILTNVIIAHFDAALKTCVREFSEKIENLFGSHAHRADELINLVRQTAANLLDIPFREAASSDAFEPKRDPFWVTAGRTVGLNPFPSGALDHLLPASIRRKRVRARLREEIDAVSRRNVENLRWATRQNLEDAFRRFGADLDERIAMSLDATRGAMKAARDRRVQHAEAVGADIAENERAASSLAELAAAIAQHQKQSVRDPSNPP